MLFILGDVLGASVYALVGKRAEVGGAVWVPSLVTLGFAVLTAVFDAELITRYPMAGGVRHALGKPSLSFLIGFCMFVDGVISAAGVCQAFA